MRYVYIIQYVLTDKKTGSEDWTSMMVFSSKKKAEDYVTRKYPNAIRASDDDVWYIREDKYDKFEIVIDKQELA